MEIENPKINLSKQLKWTTFLTQINVCFTVWCLYFVAGFPIGSPTVVLPQLIKESNNTMVISENMRSWIGSIAAFSGVFFVFVYIFIIHFVGRQKTMLVTSVITIAASVLLYFGHNPMHVLLSQILFGNLNGASFTVFPMIITEYSSTQYRGIFLTLKSATFFWGIWTANAIGIFTHYKYIGLLSILVSIYCFISSLFIPESPYWLAFDGKYDKCVHAHRLLKGEEENAEKELEDLISSQKERIRNKKPKNYIQKYITNYFQIIKEPEFFKPVVLSSIVFLIYHLSGKLACAVYAIELMKQLTGDETSAHIGVLVLDGFSVLGMYIGCGVSKIVKRRTILLVTSLMAVCFLLIMALYLYLVKLSIILSNLYVITVLLVCYSLAVCCGPAIMSTSIFGELVPIKARSFSLCISASLCTTYYSVILKVAPLMFRNFGIHGTFLAYGISCAVCILLAYKFLPETKDKSLYEIAALFEKKKPEKTVEIKLLQNIDTVN